MNNSFEIASIHFQITKFAKKVLPAIWAGLEFGICEFKSRPDIQLRDGKLVCYHIRFEKEQRNETNRTSLKFCTFAPGCDLKRF